MKKNRVPSEEAKLETGLEQRVLGVQHAINTGPELGGKRDSMSSCVQDKDRLGAIELITSYIVGKLLNGSKMDL